MMIIHAALTVVLALGSLALAPLATEGRQSRKVHRLGFLSPWVTARPPSFLKL